MKKLISICLLLLFFLSSCRWQKEYYQSASYYKKEYRKNLKERGIIFHHHTQINGESNALIQEIVKLGASFEPQDASIQRIYFKKRKLRTLENLQKLDELLENNQSVRYYGAFMNDKKEKPYMMLNNQVMVLFHLKTTREEIDKVVSENNLEFVREISGQENHIYQVKDGKHYDILKAAIQIVKSGICQEVWLDGYAPDAIDNDI